MAQLPGELLHLICDEIGQFHDPKVWNPVLLNLMLTSRMFYRAARPILYRALTSDSHNDFPFLAILTLFKAHPLTPNLVRELHMGCWVGYWKATARDRLSNLSPDLIAWMVSSAQSIDCSTSLRTEIQKGLKLGDKDAMACLLLALCKKVEVLDIEPYRVGKSLMVKLVQESVSRKSNFDPSGAARKDNPLQRLHTFHTRHWDSEHAADIVNILPFWRLPSLDTFTGRQMHWTWHSSGHDDPGSNLRRLEFTDSLIDASELESILEFCPHLRELDIEIGGEIYGNCVMDYGDYGEVLRHYGEKLERFVLYANGSYKRYELNDRVLGDLSDGMKALETVFVEWDAVYGTHDEHAENYLLRSESYLARTLPAGIKELGLRQMVKDCGCVERLDRQLEVLMGSEAHAALHRIQIVRLEGFKGELPRGWRCSLQQEAKGVEEDNRTFKFWNDVPGQSRGWMCLERDGGWE